MRNMVDEIEPDFEEVSCALEEINSTLLESSTNDGNFFQSNASSLFLKELLQKQEQSHLKIKELQHSIQSKEYTSLQMPESNSTFQESDVVRSSEKRKLNFENWETDSDVSLQPFMCDGVEKMRNSLTESDEEDLTTMGSYKNIFVEERREMADKSLGSISSNISMENTSRKSHNSRGCDDLSLGASRGEECRSQSRNENSRLSTNSDVLLSRCLDEPFASKQKQHSKINSPKDDDELSLCIDIMASRMKELELEKEQVKLDVIVALRKRFQSLTAGTKLRGGDNVQTGIFEKLNDSIYDITLDEVEKIRTEERGKLDKIDESYRQQVNKLSQDVENLAKEKCNLLTELADSKKSHDLLEKRQSKVDRVENRVSYLESLLLAIEKENTKLKSKLERSEGELSSLQRENKILKKSSSDAQRKFDVVTSAEAKMKQFYDSEHQKLVDDSKQAKMEILTLQNKLQTLQQEKERIVNSKETDLSIIKHLEEKLKRQSALLDTISADSSKYFEKNLQLENKKAEYKQKLKTCAYGIESTQEENLKLKEEKQKVEEEKVTLKKSLSEAKRRESEVLFQMKRLKSECDKKKNGWTVQKESLESRLKSFAFTKTDNSFAVLDQNKWSDSLGRVITSSLKDDVRTSHLGEKIDLSPKQIGTLSYERGLTSNFVNDRGINRLSPKKLFSENESGFEGSPLNEHIFSPRKPMVSFDLSSHPMTTNKVNPIRSVNDKHTVPLKYRGDDTKMFLKEMSYKLEHTEAALKLADQETISQPLFSESAEKLHQKLLGLRKEVLHL